MYVWQVRYVLDVHITVHVQLFEGSVLRVTVKKLESGVTYARIAQYTYT